MMERLVDEQVASFSDDRCRRELAHHFDEDNGDTQVTERGAFKQAARL